VDVREEKAQEVLEVPIKDLLPDRVGAHVDLSSAGNCRDERRRGGRAATGNIARQPLRGEEKCGRGSKPGNTVGAAFPFLPLPLPFPNPSPIQDFGHGNGFGFGDAGSTCVVTR
jgi:hypothetical protein